MNPDEETQARERIIQAGHALYARGLSPGSTGNISVRLTTGELVITPTDSSLGFLAAPDLALIGTDGTVSSGSARPSKEAPLHRVCYEQPGVGAVVHLHSGWATALACLADVPGTVARLTPYFAMKVGRLPLIPYFPPGDAAGPELLRTHAAGHHAALLANHGLLAAGATLPAAVNVAEEIEHTARLWFTLRGERVRTLGDGDLADLARRYPLPGLS